MSYLEEWMSPTWADITTVALSLIAAVAAYLVIRLLLPLAARVAQRSRFFWDDLIADRKLRHRIALAGPATLLCIGARLLGDQSATWVEALRRTTTSLLVLVGAMSLSAMLRAANTLYEQKEISKDRPIEAYTQLGQLLVYLFALVVIIATLLDRSPWLFVSGLGALTAVLLLIFKDTILSFVASIQIVQNDLVDVGDWIEMPELNADGFVIDVTLHTIKVQNFDKTITTIPTHKLVTDSFQNWRGMFRAERRRIKRSIHIDMSTIRFLSDEEIDRFSRFGPLQGYMAAKLTEIEADRRRSPTPDDVTDDPRRLTNIGTLRAYITEYLRSIEAVDTDDTIYLVRQLQPGPRGLPLEIYVFARNTDWTSYEAIQSDLFDHILAMVPEFGLRIFQDPTGTDMRHLAGEPGTASRSGA